VRLHIKTKSSRAFTLLELMISISILALIMLFLYQSLAQLQKSNRFFGEKMQKVTQKEKIKKLFFLDFSLMLAKTLKVENVDKKEDRLFFQTTNSLHQRFNPYITYIKTDKHLFRIESSKKLSYPLESNIDIDVDDLGKVDHFRFYTNKTSYRLLDTMLDNENYLMKINSYNQN